MLNAIKLVSYIPKSVKIVSNAQLRFYGVEVRGTVERYIQYYHLIPKDLPKEFWKKEWLDSGGNLREYARMRWKGGINSASNHLTDEQRVQAVINALAEGFNPFDKMMQQLRELNRAEPQQAVLLPISKKTGISLKAALDKWIANYPEYVMSDGEQQKNPTWEHAMGTKRMLEDYFDDHVLSPVSSITTDELEECLKYNEELREWKKSSYNDRMRKFKTVFKFFKKKKFISENPADGLDAKTKVARTRHEYIDETTSGLIFRKIAEHPDQKAAQAVKHFLNAIYYTCTRPNKETRRLRCGDILWEENKIDINPNRAKQGLGGFIPLAAEFADILKKMGVHKCPPEYFIFGDCHVPGPVAIGYSEYSDWFRLQIREPNGIDEKFTPYGFKHTRVRDLHRGSASIYQIQTLCRHASPSQTEQYLKELGCMVDQSVNSKSSRQL